MLKSKTAKEALLLSSVAASFMAAVPLSSNAAGISAHPFSRVAVNAKQSLRFGYSGMPVKNLQLQLKKLDFYNQEINGKYGIHTQNAIKNVQKIHGLKQDGIANPITLQKIKEMQQQKLMTLKIGDTGTEVEQLQVRLQKLNYYQGKIDGIFGSQTQQAVTMYQQQNNLKVDGIAGKNTLTSLTYNKNKRGKTYTTVKINNISTFSVDTSVVAIAKEFIGSPYRWGGTTPNGFDCSGFLKFIYEKRGINIPRTVNDIWNFGMDVGNLSVGDIVFFQTYKPGPSHAGIYIGNGNFIHTDSDRGVTISSLSTSYWKARYLGAKRIGQYHKS